MKHNPLGASPLEGSEIGLGSMTWGEQNTESEAHAQIAWALERGINFIDTAEMYPVPPRRETQGRTEAILGTWLGRQRAPRGALVIASKIAGPGRREWIQAGAFELVPPTELPADLERVNRIYPSPAAQ